MNNSMWPHSFFETSLSNYSLKEQITLWLCLLTVLLLCLPFFLDFLNADNLINFSNNSLIEVALESRMYNTSLIISLIVSVFLLTLLLIFYCLNLRNDIALFMLVPVLIMHDVIVLFIVIPNRSIQLFWTILNIRDYVFAQSILLYLQRFAIPIYDDYSIPFIMTTCSCFVIFREYSLKMTDFSFTSNIGFLSSVCISFIVIAVTYNSYRLVKYLFVNKKKWSSIDVDCLVFSFTIFIGAFMVIIFHFIFGDISICDLSPIYLTMYTFLILICAIFIALRYHQTVDTVLQRAVSVKKTFVKYVNHEIRTPLNVISLSLVRLKQLYSEYNLKFNDFLASAKEKNIDLSDITTIDSILESSTELEENLSNATKASDMANLIIEELSKYEKIENDIYELSLNIVPALSFIYDSVSYFKLHATSKKMNIQFELNNALNSIYNDRNDVFINIDVGKLRQALGNMLSNAIKFSPIGSTIIIDIRLLCIRPQEKLNNNYESLLGILDPNQNISYGSTDTNLTTNQKDIEKNEKQILLPTDEFTHIQVSVIDQGPGISIENQKKLFKKTVQFNSNLIQDGGGSGVGLFMSHDIVVNHGGTMGVYSKGEGQGSTFYMTIKLCDKVEQEDVTSSFKSVQDTRMITSRSSKTSLLIKQKSLHVLCVDDVPSNNKILRKILSNFEAIDLIDSASNGIDALKFIQRRADESHPYDLILMDFEMPIMNGPTTAKKAREIGYRGQIIGLTGNTHPDDIKLFKDHGANNVIFKPCKIEKLVIVIDKLCSSPDSYEAACLPLEENKNKPKFKLSTKAFYQFAIGALVIFTVLLILFHPIFQQTNAYSDDTISYESIKSIQYQDAVLVSLIVSIIIALELCTTSTSLLVSGINLGSFSVLLVSLLLNDFSVLFIIIPYRQVKLFWSLMNCRDYLFVIFFLSYLSDHGGIIWSSQSWRNPSSFILTSLYLLLRTYSSRLVNFTTFFGIMASITLFTLFSVVLESTFSFYRERIANKWTSKDTDCLIFSVILCLGIMSIFMFELVFGEQKLENMTMPFLVVHSYTSVLLTYILLCNIKYRSIRYIMPLLDTKDKVEMKRSFVRNVSHEIRTPLNVLSLGFSLIKASIDNHIAILEKLELRYGSYGANSKADFNLLLLSANEMRKLIPDCENQCLYAVDILSDLLTYEKFESGLVEFELTLEPFIPYIQELVAQISGTKKFVINYISDSDEEFRVQIDKTKIRDVFKRLFNYSLRDAVDIEILVSPKHKNFQPMIEVILRGNLNYSDEDTNFMDGNQYWCHNVVELDDDLNSNESYCMNLHSYVCTKIIQEHKGQLENTVNSNSSLVFVISLPIYFPLQYKTDSKSNDEIELNQIKPITKKDIIKFKKGTKIRILCVDDSIMSLKMLIKTLKIHIICDDPISAINGQDAIDKIEKSINDNNPYELVLMDQEMPIVDGLLATKTARQLGFKGLIVGLTGNVMTYDMNRFKKSGADYVLSKPLSIESLINIVFSEDSS